MSACAGNLAARVSGSIANLSGTLVRRVHLLLALVISPLTTDLFLDGGGFGEVESQRG